MEVAERQTLEGRPVVKLIHTARSNEFISAFYPVNNRVESLLDEEAGYPHHLLFKRREGRRKNDIEVVFDQTAHRATVTKDGTTETMEVPPESRTPSPWSILLGRSRRWRSDRPQSSMS